MNDQIVVTETDLSRYERRIYYRLQLAHLAAQIAVITAVVLGLLPLAGSAAAWVLGYDDVAAAFLTEATVVLGAASIVSLILRYEKRRMQEALDLIDVVRAARARLPGLHALHKEIVRPRNPDKRRPT